MNVGFDFDKVFINYPPLVPYTLIDLLYKGRSYFLKNLGKNDQMHYRFPGTIEQRIRVLSHYSILRPPIKTNIEALKKIAGSKKHKTFLISSRFGFLEKKTDEVLRRNNLKKYFDGVYFNFNNEQPHLFKEKTIKKLHIDTYIDDDLHVALYLAKQLPKLTIYWVNEGSVTNIPLPKNILPIKDLSHLDKKLLKK